MRRWLLVLCCAVALLGLPGVSRAALHDRGGGLIYDDVLDVTWLQDASYAGAVLNWDNAVAWTENLEYFDSVRGTTLSDWRLPQALPLNGSSYDYNSSFAGDTDLGWNITAPGTFYAGNTNSEMAYMYYVNLGNLGWYDTDGTQQAGGGLVNTDPFLNIQEVYAYWTGNVYETLPSEFPRAWSFNFGGGEQGSGRQQLDGRHVWAVRDGDVSAVPIPAGLWLLGSGLLGLLGLRRRFIK